MQCVLYKFPRTPHTHPHIRRDPYVLSNVYPACISRMYLPYTECISVNISYLSRIINQYRA